jgi:glycerol-3-phosphate cytidylyltransferase
MTTVLTIGTFDLLHFGHVAFLKQCRRLGTGLYVGVNTDRFAEEFKRRPVMSQEERMHALQLLGYETWLNDSAGRDLIGRLRPDVLAVGSDWARKDYYAQIDCSRQWLDQHRIILAYVPYVQHMPISTSEIRRRVVEASSA